MECQTIYQVNEEDLKAFVSDTIKAEVKESVLGMFNNVLIGSNSVCEILGITNPTLLKYIDEDRVRIVSQPGKRHKFDLAEILKLDVKKFARVSNLRFKKVGK